MSLRAAVAFFTRLPTGSSEPLPLRGAASWLPVVGVLVGFLVAAVSALSSLVLPAPICGVAGCLAWAAATGGLHLDGLADCGDGLFAEAPPERRLEIMKDPRLGTFGGAALFFALAFKCVALATLAADFEAGLRGFFSLAVVCCAAGATSRALVFQAMRLPSARPGGLGEALREGADPRLELAGSALAVVLCLCGGWRGIVALVASFAAARLLLSCARKRLGGVSGDVFGCLIELAECVALAAFCLR